MGFKIAVASGKGGTGKSTVSVNLFQTIRAVTDKTVQIIDCDVEEPNDKIFLKDIKPAYQEPVEVLIPKINSDRCTFCGKCVDVCSYNAILMVKGISHIKVMDDLCHSCGACTYFCPEDKVITEHKKRLGSVNAFTFLDEKEPTFFEGRLDVGEALAVPVIKETKNKSTDDGITIIDAPPGTSCPAMEVVEDADYTILVGEPTPFGMNDLKIMLETVQKMKRNVGVIINRADVGTDELEKYLIEQNVDVLAKIPFKKQIAETYSNGDLLVDNIPEIKELFIDVWNKINKNYLK
ncbi:MAG: ATP-binding protein [Bacteroidota bacterium]|nr:ATP-binding protein [Bacteroidota bacterium]